MTGYLLKTEPSEYSFADLQRDTATVWDGVSNPVALKNLRAMEPGAKLVIYETGTRKSAVGTATVVSVDVSNPKNPAVKINVRYDAAVRIEIPDQPDRIYRGAVRGIRRLKNHEDRNRVDRVLESPAQEAGTTRRRNDPSVAKAGAPNPGVLRDPIRTMPSHRPNFHLISVRLRPILGAHRRSEVSEKHPAKKEQNSKCLHR